MNRSYSNFPICIGPMSSEVVESVYRYSHQKKVRLYLISSKNQIDHNGGYVNNWNTNQYCNFLKKLKKEYFLSNVLICRDHCGPGFNGNYELTDTYKTIENDIENNFDLIHIDLSLMQNNYGNILSESKKAITFAKSLSKKIMIEIGTDENLGQKYSHMHINEFRDELFFFLDFIDPEFFVVPTGSLVLENYQVGSFNKSFLKSLKNNFSKYDIKLKEHNADYLSVNQINLRKKIIDAVNIAPQFGYNQTQCVLWNCMKYGINTNEFLELSYLSKKWKKWLHKINKNNKYLCAMIAGHYNFNSKEYKRLINDLNKIVDIKEIIISSHLEIINFYFENFKRINNE